MQYFFIPGTHPLLSVAEIISIFGVENKENTRKIINTKMSDAFIFDIKKEFDPKELIKKLGGTVKIGSMNYEVRIMNNQFNNKILSEILDNCLKMIGTKAGESKFNFGISVYGTDSINIKHLGLTLKNKLKEKGVSCRWVVSKEKNLSSVVVDTNHLTGKGMEIVLIKCEDRLYIGHTLAVQPFRELSFRDYGRPARDDLSGMLPPKLAQVMINLSGAKHDDTILDPFCGSGTIITEAMLMGYQNIIGSDISKKAVEDTKRNIEWVKELKTKNGNYLIGNSLEIVPHRFADMRDPALQGIIKCGRNWKLEIKNSDILELTNNLPLNSVDAIVTEPYLGPQRGNVDLYKTKKELETLYSKSLEIFDKLLKPGGKIVMIWPVFVKNGNSIILDIDAKKQFKPVDYLLRELLDSSSQNEKIRKQVTGRDTLVYGRHGQKVWREVVVLTKK